MGDALQAAESFRFESYKLIDRKDEYICEVTIKGKRHYIHIHKSPIESLC